MEIYGPIKLRGSLVDGTGDPLLTKDSTSNEVGTAANSLGTLSSANIFVGNSDSEPTGVAVTGDISIDNTGVTSIASGVIVNADIKSDAAITLSKLASVTASRALVSDSSGVVSVSDVTATELSYLGGVTGAIQTQFSGKQATITGAATTITGSNLTASRALVSNSSGKVVVSSITDTELSRLSGASSNLQTQLDTKLGATISSVATGDILYYNGTAWGNLARGTNGQALYSTSTSIQWDTPTINGIPVGGTDGQVLAKTSGTDFEADWETLSVSSISDLTATAAELNILDGATITATELNFLDNASANIQDQLNNKMSNALATGNIYKGVSGVATASTDLPTGITIGGSAIYRSGGSDVSLADGGTGASLSDPNADRIMFWDDSAGQVTWLEAGDGLSISGTTISALSSGWPLEGSATVTDDVDISGTKSVKIRSTVASAQAGFELGTSGDVSLFSGGTATGFSNAQGGIQVQFTSLTVKGKLTLDTQTSTRAALVIPPGELLGSEQDGAIENDGDHLYYTDSAGERYKLDQQSTSGTYTPTLTNQINASTSDTLSTAWNWLRVGDVVNVSGALSVSPTGSGSTRVKFTLPFASTFSSSYQCTGCGATELSTSPLVPCSIQGDTVDLDRGQLQFYAASSSSVTFLITFQYRIV